MKILIAILSVAVSAYAVEVALTFLPIGITRAEERAEFVDPGSKPDVIKRFRVRGMAAVPAVHPAMFLSADSVLESSSPLLPLGGTSNRLTVYCNESGVRATFQSDRFGFNNLVDFYDDGERVDVIMVGDSYAQGACVEQDQTLNAHFVLDGHRSLTFGSGSNGPLTELATINEFGQALEPRVVLWLYYEGNDLENQLREMNNPILERYLADPTYRQDLMLRQDEIDTLLLEYVEREEQTLLDQMELDGKERKSTALGVMGLSEISSRITRLLDRRRSSTPEQTAKDDAEREVQGKALLEKFSSVMKAANARVDRWGGRMYFVYLPDWGRSRHSRAANYRYREDVLDTVTSHGIPIIDFSVELSGKEDPLSFYPFRLQGHLTEAGYAALYDQVVSRLLRDGVL